MEVSDIKIENVRIASTSLERLVGLIGKEPLKKNEALLINKCNAVHTMFMKYPIDAIFLDEKMRIVSIENNICPWKKTKFYPKAHHVLEISSQKHDFIIGNQLVWLDNYSLSNT